MGTHGYMEYGLSVCGLESGDWVPCGMKKGHKDEKDEPAGHDAATAAAAADNDVEFLGEGAHNDGLRRGRVDVIGGVFGSSLAASLGPRTNRPDVV